MARKRRKRRKKPKLSKTRTFGGQNFTLHRRYPKKKQAEKQADRLRKLGWKVRQVKLSGAFGSKWGLYKRRR